MVGFDDYSQTLDLINVLVEISLVPGVVFVEKLSSCDFASGVPLYVLDQLLFGVLAVVKDVLVEQAARVVDHR